jgi:hypothetical protein
VLRCDREEQIRETSPRSILSRICSRTLTTMQTPQAQDSSTLNLMHRRTGDLNHVMERACGWLSGHWQLCRCPACDLLFDHVYARINADQR